MRLNILISFLVLVAVNLSAQVSIGVKTFYGVNYTPETAKEFVNLEPLRLHNIAFKGATAKRGIGISVLAQNEKLFFMADGMFANGGRQFALQSVNANRDLLDPEIVFETEEFDFRLATIMGYNYKNFKFGAGPEMSVNLTMKESLSTIEEVTANKSAIKGGVNFLIGYRLFDHLHIDLKHTYMFQDVSHEFQYLGMDMDMKTNIKYAELTLAYYL